MHEHEFIDSEFYGYEKCVDCGSYHSIKQVEPKKIYEDADYWSYEEKRSKPEEQVNNLTCIDDCGISKVDRILQFVPNGTRVLEIACFPGILMKKLLEKGYVDVIGIEPAEKYNDFIGTQATGATIINGYFPEILQHAEDNLFNCIIGMDVFEHVDNYDVFMKTVHRLLVPRGTAIFMSPIILNDGMFRYRDFHHPDEHCWIHTQRFLEPYLKSIFSEVEFKRWVVGHEIIILTK